MPEGLFAVHVGDYIDGNPQDIRTMRPLRGRVVVEVEPEIAASQLVWTPGTKQRALRIHVGRVISFGAPARRGDVEVPHEFAAGDRVLFVYTVALEKSRRFAGNLCVVAQEEIQAVLEGDTKAAHVGLRDRTAS
jgi:co-chaperonin GroES (HSP10)